MSDYEPVEGVVPDVSQQPQEAPAEGGHNPRWDGFLKDIPTAYHPMFEKQLSEWDKGVNQRFQEIHQEYSPYKEFKEQQVDPELLRYGLQILDVLENNPQGLYTALQQNLGLTPEQAQQVVEGQQPPDQNEYADPRVDRLEQGFVAMYEQMQGETQRQVDATEDARLLQDFAELHTKYGNFDEGRIAGIALLNNVDIEQALQMELSYIDQIRQQPRAVAGAPPILGSGNGVPSAAIDPSQMSDKERRDLAVQMLNRAKGG